MFILLELCFVVDISPARFSPSETKLQAVFMVVLD